MDWEMWEQEQWEDQENQDPLFEDRMFAMVGQKGKKDVGTV